ncbi:MAG: hypothetical protein HRU13_11140, partial [Phycisphaerales bacterium]|nr:hypothetical protein [Phycisphaerales bacterium]
MLRSMNTLALGAAGLLAVTAASHAQVTGTNLGTAAPPSELDGYTMVA